MQKMGHIETIRQQFDQLGIDAFVVTELNNIRYLSNFSGSNAMILITRDKCLFLTDGRYTIQAKSEITGDFEILITSQKQLLAADLITADLQKIGVEVSLTLTEFCNLKNHITAELVVTENIIEDLRLCKSDAEIAKIQKAHDVLIANFINLKAKIVPGQTTEVEVASMVYDFGIKNGMEKLSFDTIALSGVNGSMPHGMPSTKVIQNGELLTVDCGYVIDGYCADMTRTFAIGEVSTEMRDAYNAVLKSQMDALAAIAIGAKCSTIYDVSYASLAKVDLAQYFPHGLGHGLGIQVHEAPYFNSVDKSILRGGEVLSVEPGVYLEGKFGLRIEDIICVTKDGYHNFSGALAKDFDSQIIS